MGDVLESATIQDSTAPARPHCGLAEVLADPWLYEELRRDWAQ